MNRVSDGRGMSPSEVQDVGSISSGLMLKENSVDPKCDVAVEPETWTDRLAHFRVLAADSSPNIVLEEASPDVDPAAEGERSPDTRERRSVDNAAQPHEVVIDCRGSKASTNSRSTKASTDSVRSAVWLGALRSEGAEARGDAGVYAETEAFEEPGDGLVRDGRVGDDPLLTWAKPVLQRVEWVTLPAKSVGRDDDDGDDDPKSSSPSRAEGKESKSEGMPIERKYGGVSSRTQRRSAEPLGPRGELVASESLLAFGPVPHPDGCDLPHSAAEPKNSRSPWRDYRRR